MSKNPQAFPGEEMRNTSSDPLATPRPIKHPGMTLRDWFAGKALAGLIGTVLPALSKNPAYPSDDAAYKVVALAAYAMSDAMLAAREQPQ